MEGKQDIGSGLKLFYHRVDRNSNGVGVISKEENITIL